MTMAFHILWLLALCTLATSSNDDWTNKCNKCKCLWSSGRKTADCTNTNFSEIPKDLSSEIREIDFSGNPLFVLGKEVMLGAGVRNIHKLKFQNCNITSVNELAFKDLLLLIELDLSKNSIQVLSRGTFRDNSKLRVLCLSYNNLRTLDDGLFYNLTHLQKIILNNNEIERIDGSAFQLLPILQQINFGSNRLRVMSVDFLKNVPKINSLSLEGNPWKCDCHLQDFRNQVFKESLITTPTECAEPINLKGRLWRDTDVFPCVPQIVEPLPSTQIQATTNNVTLTCRVLGEPQPDVDWVSNGRIIDRDPRQNTQRFLTSKQKVGNYTYNNLTITNVNYRDRGEYKCVAKNPGGTDEKNISLIVSVVGGAGGGAFPYGSALPLIIGLSVGAVVILIVIIVLICCCCKGSNAMNSKRRDLIQNSSDECIRLHHGQPEIEKALITDVNPVMKPPRVCSVPPSVNSVGTEVSEVKKNLLDSDSAFAAGDDESRSLDFDMHLYPRSQTIIDADYRTNHPYPPDLLPFPPRMMQVSPAGSSASTVADTSRLPAHHGPQSPIHSPIYDSMSLYKTLPYSRSQSPFVGPPARVPRQGYVTIPRRPRQRWSGSEAPSTSDVEEPLYDNLGLRTTVDGSSVLSLNKVGEATTPKSLRMFPMSPSSCDPIAEHESPPTRETLKLSPSRTEWARANAEVLRSPENRRNSMPGDGKLKIAPIPPPKPKKRTSTGPLFEDEGEDGTEV